MQIKENNFIGFGSNRIVYQWDRDRVIKFPISELGILANTEEYSKYLLNKDCVAKTSITILPPYDYPILLQEKLYDVKVFTYAQVRQPNFEQLLDQIYGTKAIKFHNKIELHKCSIGCTKNKQLKMYDYERIKCSLPVLRNYGIDLNIELHEGDEQYFYKYLQSKQNLLFDKWLEITYPTIYQQRKIN